MAQNHGAGVIYHNKFKNEDLKVVFINIQTGGLTSKCDILQVGLRCNKQVFETYIRPSKPIPAEVTRINGFSSIGTTLYLHGKEVETVSLSKAVREILHFLDSFEEMCVLVAHQSDFHVKKLKRIFRICRSFYKTSNMIEGYSDSLSLFRKVFPGIRGKGQMTLEGLAKNMLSFPILHRYHAGYNAFLLEQLVFRYIDYNELVGNSKDWFH